MENFKDNINLISKKFKILIFVTIIIFTFRNYDRIKYEMETYNYKPLKNFYFKIENKSFNLQDNLKVLISGYNTCQKNDKNCQFTIDENIYVK